MKRLNQFNLKLILSLLIAALPFANVFSNKIAVSLVSANQSTGEVTFDLSWQNSWRDAGTTAANWDAAWVFVKWRDCTAPSNTQFTHGLISTALGDHNFNVNSGTTTFEPTMADGSAIVVDPSPNNTGVMLRNAATPAAGTVSARVKLKLNNLPSTGTLDLKVYGIEMVFVPQGTYYLGDGNGSVQSSSSFYSTSNTAAQISSETAQTVFEGLLLGTVNLTAAFPKGYNPFYIMKYEITQGQYAEFLNTIPGVAQSAHYAAQFAGTNRYTITNSTVPGTYTASRPYRACNFLSWGDVGTFLEWAALRPLTELEYEKACRGTGPRSPYENAMAVGFCTRAVTITAGTEPGTEVITVPGNANISAGTTAFTGGDAGQGPLRGGIFATASTVARSETGAGFYGVMELSGNVDEYYISCLSGVSGGFSASGVSNGDGILDDATGNFNTFNGWPNPLSPGNSIIHRGGSWNATVTQDASAASYLNVSNRGGGALTTRVNTSGGRGGRSFSAGNTALFTYKGVVETFVVPPGVTSLTIDAYGGGGGITSTTSAGYGAQMKGVCTVTPGEVLQILVGGTTNAARNGGGGTFVVRAPYNTLASCLVVAGGGGGFGGTANSAAARNGQLGTSGGDGYNYPGSGGTSGNGGLSGVGYGAGAGFLTNGAGSPYGGTAFINGGTINTSSGTAGFGGGGTTPSTSYGGGAGGYSGGGQSNTTGGGGGGGSIINGTTITATQTGMQYGFPGQVILTW